jgi:hypothetical protein
LRIEDLQLLEKGAYIVIVWIIPILGAVIMWLLNKNHKAQLGIGSAFSGGLVALVLAILQVMAEAAVTNSLL